MYLRSEAKNRTNSDYVLRKQAICREPKADGKVLNTLGKWFAEGRSRRSSRHSSTSKEALVSRSSCSRQRCAVSIVWLSANSVLKELKYPKKPTGLAHCWPPPPPPLAATITDLTVEEEEAASAPLGGHGNHHRHPAARCRHVGRRRCGGRGHLVENDTAMRRRPHRHHHHHHHVEAPPPPPCQRGGRGRAEGEAEE